LPTFTGNITGNIVTLTGNISSINANLGNLVVANYHSGNGSLLTGLTGANVTGTVANATYAVSAGSAGTVTTAAQPNITSVGTLTSLTSGLITATSGGIKVGNIQDPSGTNTISIASGNVSMLGSLNVGTGGSGNVTATYFIGNGSQLTGLPATYSNTNVASYLPTYTGNITGNTITLTSNITSINASLGNLVTANYFSGAGNLLSNIVGSNVTGQVANALIATTVTDNAQPNITSLGTLSGLTVSGDTTLTGNLTVTGTFEYANVTSFRVKDPIIEQGGNPNGTALASNDGFDRGQLLHYYSGAAVDAFMGWDNSNAEFALGSNVTVASEVVTFNTFGNLRAGYFLGNGSQLTGIATATTAGTVTTAAQPNITSVGTLNGLTSNSVVNFINASNVSLGSNANVKITGGSASQYLQTDGTGNLTWATVAAGSGSNISNGTSNVNISTSNGNVQVVAAGNIIANVTGTGVNITGTVTASGLVTATSGGVKVGNIQDPSGTNTISIASGNVSTLGGLTVGTGGSGNLSVAGVSSLGPVGNVKITGGTTGQYLKTDGTGNLSWAAASGGGGATYTAAATPPGTPNVADQWFNTTTNVLYEYMNDGSANYWIDIQTPTVATSNAGAILNIGSFNNRNYTGTGAQVNFTITTGLTVSTVLVVQDGVVQTPTTDYTISGTTLTFTTAPANGSNIQIRELGYGVPSTTSLSSVSSATINGNLTVTANTNLGAVGNITITGGTSGQYLQTNGSGGLSFSSVITAPAGTNTQVQFNDNGSYGGNAGLIFNKTTTTLTANNFVATTTANLGSNANVTITGGSTGQLLTTNGSGGLSWSSVSGGATLATVSAATTYYLGLSAGSTGTWTDARVDTGNLSYNSGTQTLYATNYNTSSDANLKTNVQTIENALVIVNLLRGVGFEWLATGLKSYGIIAQELEQHIPDLVSIIDGKRTVNYDALIGFLIEAIKTQSTQIQSLEERITKLEQK
jgi:hypothetical protein